MFVISWMPRYWHTFFAGSFPGKVLMQTPRTAQRLFPWRCTIAPSYPATSFCLDVTGCHWMSLDVRKRNMLRFWRWRVQHLHRRWQVLSMSEIFRQYCHVVPRCATLCHETSPSTTYVDNMFPAPGSFCFPKFARSSVAITRLLLPSWTMPRVCDLRRSHGFCWKLWLSTDCMPEMRMMIVVPCSTIINELLSLELPILAFLQFHIIQLYIYNVTYMSCLVYSL